MFKVDYDRVMKELKGYAQRVVEKGGSAVILIGSLARGDYTAFSDADVVIVYNTDVSFWDRGAEFLDPSLSIELQPLVYTEGELLSMARAKRRVVKEIVGLGVLLAGDPAFLERLRAELNNTVE